MTLENQLAALLNEHSRENASNTPDHILADYMLACLEAFENASKFREQWYGGHLEPARSGGPWVPVAAAEEKTDAG